MVIGVLGVLQRSQIIGETDDIISCFVPSRWSTEQFLFVQIIILITGSLIGPASLLVCIVHYIYIFRKLRTIRKIHNSNGIMPPVLNTIDTPINSLAIAFFMAVVPYIYSANIIYVVLLCHYLMFRASFYLLPTSGPIVIFAVNKRFRVRKRNSSSGN